MQIKKTELAKIIREEIANAVDEGRRMDRFRRGRRPYPSYMAMANIHRDNIDTKKKQIERYQATLDDEAASDEDKEEARKWIDTLNRRIADDQALLDAEMEKLKRFGRIREEAEGKGCADTPKGCIRKRGDGWVILNNKKGGIFRRTDTEEEAEEILRAMHSMNEDEIKAARFDHAHLPGNDEEGQFGKVQQLEEVGILSTMLDPAIVAGLSEAARVAIALIDNILTIGLPSAAVAGLMNMLMKNEDIPKEEREMIAAALDDKKPAGIPADELGAKR